MKFNYDPEMYPVAYGGEIVESKCSRFSTNLPTSMFRERLIEQLATHLAAEAVTIEEDTYTVTHRMKVLVMTPSQLERLIQRRMYTRNPNVPDPYWVA